MLRNRYFEILVSIWSGISKVLGLNMNVNSLCYGIAVVSLMLHASELQSAMIIRCAVNVINMEFINVIDKYIPLSSIKRMIQRNTI